MNPGITVLLHKSVSTHHSAFSARIFRATMCAGRCRACIHARHVCVRARSCVRVRACASVHACRELTAK